MVAGRRVAAAAACVLAFAADSASAIIYSAPARSRECFYLDIAPERDLHFSYETVAGNLASGGLAGARSKLGWSEGVEVSLIRFNGGLPQNPDTEDPTGTKGVAGTELDLAEEKRQAPDRADTNDAVDRVVQKGSQLSLNPEAGAEMLYVSRNPVEVAYTIEGKPVVDARDAHAAAEASGGSAAALMAKRNQAIPHAFCVESTVDNDQVVSLQLKVDKEPRKRPSPGRFHTTEDNKLDNEIQHGLLQEGHGIHEYATKRHTLETTRLVEILRDKVEGIKTQQEFALTRETVHQNMAQTTSERVLWWTLGEAVLLLALAVLQFRYLRGFFEVKMAV